MARDLVRTDCLLQLGQQSAISLTVNIHKQTRTTVVILNKDMSSPKLCGKYIPSNSEMHLCLLINSGNEIAETLYKVIIETN